PKACRKSELLEVSQRFRVRCPRESPSPALLPISLSASIRSFSRLCIQKFASAPHKQSNKAGVGDHVHGDGGPCCFRCVMRNPQSRFCDTVLHILQCSSGTLRL